MDKLEKHDLRVRIQDTLDECRGCPKQFLQHPHPNQLCGGCAIYARLRVLGDELAKANKKERFEMPVEEYEAMKVQGWTDARIAKHLGISKETIRVWKKRTFKRKDENQ